MSTESSDQKENLSNKPKLPANSQAKRLKIENSEKKPCETCPKKKKGIVYKKKR